MSFMVTLLPQPLSPMSTSVSPRVHAQRHIAQHFLRAEFARNVPEFDRRRFRGRGFAGHRQGVRPPR